MGQGRIHLTLEADLNQGVETQILIIRKGLDEDLFLPRALIVFTIWS